MKQEILRFENVTCKKDGAVYLENFSFYMTAGEIVGLLSVNDRGIKELIELMAKNHPIDAGRVYMGGKLVNSYLNQEETSNRIYQIDQKSSLINDLSITDNLFVMRPGFKKQVINEWVLREQADRVLKQLSMDLDLNKRVEKAYYHGADHGGDRQGLFNGKQAFSGAVSGKTDRSGRFPAVSPAFKKNAEHGDLYAVFLLSSLDHV